MDSHGSAQVCYELTPEVSIKFYNMSFVCACMVIAIHLTHSMDGWGRWYESFYRYGIGRMAVPFFFLTSGYFLSRKIHGIAGYQNELVKRVKSLFLPYVLWQFVWIVWMIVCVGLNALRLHEPFSMLWPYEGFGNLALMGLDIWHFPAMGLLWYVRSLLILVLFSPVLFAFVRWTRGAGVLFLFILELMGAACVMPWNICNNLLPVQGMTYFFAGCFLSDSTLKMSLSRIGYCAILVIGIALCFSKSYLEMMFAVTWSKVLAHLAVPLLMIGLWGMVSSVAFASVFTKNSFALYCIHPFVFGVWSIVMGRNGDNIVGLFLQFAIGIFLSLFLICVLRKHMTPVANVLFGGR